LKPPLALLHGSRDRGARAEAHVPHEHGGRQAPPPRGRRGTRDLVRGRRGRALRAAGPERSRQDDDDQDADHAAPAHRRRSPRPRARRRPRRPRAWSSTLFGSGGALQWNRWQGTLELLVAAPPPFIVVLLPLTIATSVTGAYALLDRDGPSLPGRAAAGLGAAGVVGARPDLGHRGDPERRARRRQGVGDRRALRRDR